jgi:hypothetical protein
MTALEEGSRRSTADNLFAAKSVCSRLRNLYAQQNKFPSYAKMC